MIIFEMGKKIITKAEIMAIVIRNTLKVLFEVKRKNNSPYITSGKKTQTYTEVSL